MKKSKENEEYTKKGYAKGKSVAKEAFSKYPYFQGKDQFLVYCDEKLRWSGDLSGVSYMDPYKTGFNTAIDEIWDQDNKKVREFAKLCLKEGRKFGKKTASSVLKEFPYFPEGVNKDEKSMLSDKNLFFKCCFGILLKTSLIQKFGDTLFTGQFQVAVGQIWEDYENDLDAKREYDKEWLDSSISCNLLKKHGF